MIPLLHPSDRITVSGLGSRAQVLLSPLAQPLPFSFRSATDERRFRRARRLRPIPAIRLRVWLRAVVSNHLYRFLLTNASSFRRILPRSVCVSVLGGGSSSLFFLSGQILANPSHICGAGVCELVLRHHIKPSAPCLVPVRYIPPI